MDILKHGWLERCYEYDKEHGITLYFRCPRCMCEFSASSIQDEIISPHNELEKSAICPECKFQTFECYDSAHMLNMTRDDIVDCSTKNDGYIDPQIENFVNNFGWER